jgi:hypothetical protein
MEYYREKQKYRPLLSAVRFLSNFAGHDNNSSFSKRQSIWCSNILIKVGAVNEIYQKVIAKIRIY